MLAEWQCDGEGNPSLHVRCHVSGEERWLAPPALRNYIFKREMPLVCPSMGRQCMSLKATLKILLGRPWCSSLDADKALLAGARHDYPCRPAAVQPDAKIGGSGRVCSPIFARAGVAALSALHTKKASSSVKDGGYRCTHCCALRYM